ncbi:MAG TPA: hypothetical protein VFQ91_19075 [Bryobacteraceae bacterium]|nr:hypothetical protein [Bryobacteraceae bacterium]
MVTVAAPAKESLEAAMHAFLEMADEVEAGVMADALKYWLEVYPQIVDHDEELTIAMAFQTAIKNFYEKPESERG